MVGANRFRNPDDDLPAPPCSEDMLQGNDCRLGQVGEHFRSLVAGNQSTEWRAAIDSPNEFVAKESRAADLLIIGRDRVAGDPSRSLDRGLLC